MRICSPRVPRLNHEWNHTVGLIINLRCGTTAASRDLPRIGRHSLLAVPTARARKLLGPFRSYSIHPRKVLR